MNPSDSVFPLLPPKPRVRGWLYVLGGFFIVMGSALAAGVALLALVNRDAFIYGIPIGAIVGVWFTLGPLRKMASAPPSLPPLRIEATGLRLPRSVYSAREELLLFGSIQRLDLYVLGKARNVVVSGNGRTFVFPSTSLIDPADAVRFVQLAREALSAQRPDVLREVDRQQAIAVAIERVRPYATQVLLVIIGLAFVLTLALGGATLPVLVRLGANAPGLERDGQWFRLFTGNFLHGGWLHIYLNAMALFTLGASLERLYGTSRYLVVFLLSALGGSVASALSGSHVLSVGVSTALFGLLGSWGFAAWRLRGHLPVGFQRTRRWWLIQLGINGALSALPIVDWAGHLGGFLAGAGATAVLLGRPPQLRLVNDSRAVRAVAAGLVGTFALATVLAAKYATGPTSFVSDVARAVILLPRATPGVLNSVAWEQAKDPKADRAMIAVARQAIDRALRADPDNFQIVDTGATLRHREGDDDAAVLEECDALRLERTAHPDCGACTERQEFEAQLARFISAREEGKGPRSGEPVEAHWLPDGMRIVPPASGPAGIHAYAEIAGSTAALLEIEGPVAAPSVVINTGSLSVPWPSQLPVFACVAWGETSRPSLAVTALPLDPAVLGRP